MSALLTLSNKLNDRIMKVINIPLAVFGSVLLTLPIASIASASGFKVAQNRVTLRLPTSCSVIAINTRQIRAIDMIAACAVNRTTIDQLINKHKNSVDTSGKQMLLMPLADLSFLERRNQKAKDLMTDLRSTTIAGRVPSFANKGLQ